MAAAAASSSAKERSVVPHAGLVELHRTSGSPAAYIIVHKLSKEQKVLQGGPYLLKFNESHMAYIAS
eukprot:2478588-Lingulodinium_polyedra.AAC.1